MKIRSLLLRLTLCFVFMFALTTLSYGQSNEANNSNGQTEEVQKQQTSPVTISETPDNQNNTVNPNGSSSATEKLKQRKKELEDMLKETDPSSQEYSAIKEKIKMIEEYLENQ